MSVKTRRPASGRPSPPQRLPAPTAACAHDARVGPGFKALDTNVPAARIIADYSLLWRHPTRYALMTFSWTLAAFPSSSCRSGTSGLGLLLGQGDADFFDPFRPQWRRHRALARRPTCTAALLTSVGRTRPVAAHRCARKPPPKIGRADLQSFRATLWSRRRFERFVDVQTTRALLTALITGFRS